MDVKQYSTADGPMRWGQINMREFEPPRTDVAWWKEYWKRCGLEGITLNAGGIVAYYPTKIRLHYVSPWLNGRDIFGETVRAARELGMWVFARVDPSRTHEDFYYEHPDWFMVEQNGQVRSSTDPYVSRMTGGGPVNPSLGPRLYHTCINGPYFWDWIPKVFEEVAGLYDVQGFFGNAWEGTRDVCYCPRCQKMFQQQTGLALPRSHDWRDPSWKRWTRWHYERAEALWQHWDEVAQRVVTGGFWWGNNSIGVMATHAKMINADFQSRRGHDPIWLAGDVAKRMRSVTLGKPYYHCTSANSYSRHLARPEAEQRLWMAEGLANDARPWFTIIGSYQEDRRQFQPLEDFFSFHARHSDLFRGRESLASVGMLWSERQALYYGGDELEARVLEHNRGMYHALLRARIHFDLVFDEMMTPELLSRFKVIVLPNTACLSDEQCKMLLDYWKSGGNLVATFESSLYNEWGERRASYGLGEAFGVRSVGVPIGPLLHSYMRLDDPQSPLVKGISDTSITWNSGYLCLAEPDAELETPLTLIPPYPTYPPETAFPAIEQTHLPTVYMRSSSNGAGRCIYFPGQVDKLFWATSIPDLGLLLANAVRWAGGETLRVEVDGPGLVEVCAYRRQDDVHVHLVNLTNPGTWMAPCHELIPIGAQRVSVAIPDGRRVASAQALVSQKPVEYSVGEGRVAFSVPGILDHEIVVLQLT